MGISLSGFSTRIEHDWTALQSMVIDASDPLSSGPLALNIEVNAEPITADLTESFDAVDITLNLKTNNPLGFTGTSIAAARFKTVGLGVGFPDPSPQLPGDLLGVDASVEMDINSGIELFTVQRLIGLRASALQATFGESIANEVIGLLVETKSNEVEGSPTPSGTGTAYGVKIDDVTACLNAYAIHTGIGKVLLGDDTETLGTLKAGKEITGQFIQTLTNGGTNTLGDDTIIKGSLTCTRFASIVTAGEYSRLNIESTNGFEKLIAFKTGSTRRFDMMTDATNEAGANAGSDFQIRAFADGGALIDVPIKITRAAAGTIQLGRRLQTIAANEVTGATAGCALGANFPGTTPAAPYKWQRFTASDGTACYIPMWK